MKRWSLVAFLTLLFMTSVGSIASAETLEDQLNNLVGPQQQYNTKLSPVYLRTNTIEESISPQSGNLSIVQTDYVLPGRNGLDLEFKRIYNSGNANMQDMKVKYVNGAWVDYVESNNDTLTFTENRYNLGVGMRFSFPTMEIKKNDDNTTHKFLHTETGDVYRLRPYTMDGKIVYMPDGQTVQDVVVRESSEFNNGQTDGASQYVMTDKAGKKTYFDTDGLILGIVDRYGNKIVFENTKLNYKVNDKTITKKLISKITDTVGRVTTIEYKEDASFKVGKIENKVYGPDESYKNSQNPNNTDSGDLQGEFQVIVHLPSGQKLVYDKTAALVNSAKNVLRTRLQRVFDVDGKPKYHLWYEQPDLGFTYVNKEKYSTFNRYENLTQIDYVKTNRITRYIYGSAKRGLSEDGSMEYRKIFEKRELSKKGYDSTQSKFEDRFKVDVVDKLTYSYTNESDGYGFTGYKKDEYEYLKDTYRYYTELTDARGSKTKYTYDGLDQHVVTERTGNDHKEVTRNELDDMKLVKKTENLLYEVKNGQAEADPVRKIENFRYDEYGNLTNYTGPEAKRNEQGEPLDTEHTVVYAYAYDKYHALTSKTWKQDQNTMVQDIYEIDDKGNVVRETKVTSDDTDQWLVTNYSYDQYGNVTSQSTQSAGQTFTTYYEYGSDVSGHDVKGAYLTKEYSVVKGQTAAKRYAYDWNTGNVTVEIDAGNHRKEYQYDALERVKATIYPDGSKHTYEYEENGYANFKIRQIDPEQQVFLYEYDILGYQLQESVQSSDNQWLVLSSVQYDFNHNKTEEKDANGNFIRYEYDSDNQLLKRTAYDKGGTIKGSVQVNYRTTSVGDAPLILTVTDEEGYPQTFYYDILNRLIRTDTTPDRNRILTSSYQYDYTGNLIAETDAMSYSAHLRYDSMGRLLSRQDQLGNMTSYAYNAFNQVTEQEEPDGKITTNLYDELGRISEKRISKKGSSDYFYEAYDYDLSGNLISLQKGQVISGIRQIAADTTYAYDDLDRLIGEYPKIDSLRTGTIHHEYDKNGNRIKTIEYTDVAKKEYSQKTWAYDYAGRVTEETGQYSQASQGGEHPAYGSYHHIYKRDAAGNIVEQQRDNGTSFDTVTLAYDYRNQIVERYEPYGNQAKGKYTRFSYDRAGRVTVETQRVQGTELTTSYVYDGLGRLIRKSDPLGNASRYVYDANGNLIKEIDPRYSALTEEEAPGFEHKYDGLNRLVSTSAFDGKVREVISYKHYDGRNNIVLATQGEGYNDADPTSSIGTVFEYDALDRPIQTISAQTASNNLKSGSIAISKKSLYDGAGNLLMEMDALGATTKYSYYLNGLPKDKTFADGSKEAYDYDPSGKAWREIVDRNGGFTKQHLSILGKPARIDYPDGTSELFFYSPKGELSKKVDQAGNEQRMEYDASGNMTVKLEFISAQGSTKLYKRTEMKYDEANRLLTTETFRHEEQEGAAKAPVITSVSDRVTNVYDKAGRITRTFDQDGRESLYEYDRAGNIVLEKRKVSDNNYDMIRYEYDVQSHQVTKSILVRMSELAQEELKGAQFDDAYIDRVLSNTHYVYNENGQLIKQMDAKGKATLFTYDLDNRLIMKTDPLNGITSYEYDGNGQMVEETDANGAIRSYEYDKVQRLVRKKEPAAGESTAITRYIYDAAGNLIKEIAPNQYDAALDQGVRVLEMAGVAYKYDSMNRRIVTYSPEGKAVEYVSYDAAGRPNKWVDGLRYTGSIVESSGMTTEYDGLGRKTKEVDALGGTVSYSYDILGHVIQMTDKRGSTTKYSYNADGTVSTMTNADGGTVKYIYDLLGRKILETNPLGIQMGSTYNSFGKEMSLTDAYGHMTESKYDLVGNLVSYKDKRGSISLYKYDAKGQLIQKKTPLEADSSGNMIFAVETYSYDPIGRLLKQTLSSSRDQAFLRETAYTYYLNGLVQTQSDNSGGLTETFYDLNGNAVRTEVSRSANDKDTEQFVYDSSNRMIQRAQLIEKRALNTYAVEEDSHNTVDVGLIELVTSYKHDLLGNIIAETDPQGHETTYVYDALNRLSSRTQRLAGQEAEVKYTYDLAGNRVSETNELGFTRKFTYDAMNRVATITDAEGHTSSYEYDLAGNKSAETDALGNRISYTYDQLDRPLSIIDAYGTLVVYYVYDAAGNRIKDIDALGYQAGNSDQSRYGETYVYDLAGRRISKTDREGFTTTYKYNPAGELLQETNPLGHTHSYEYDNAGRLIKVTDPLGVGVSYSYDLAGNKQDMTEGRGKVTRYEYGSFGLLIGLINPDNKRVSYSYDSALNIAEMIDKNGNHTRYTYDHRNLLLSSMVEETGDAIRFTYDLAGNRLSMEDESGNTTYEYDRNSRVTGIFKNSSKQISYTYDAVGNVTSLEDKKGNTTHYRYDQSNRMSSVESAGKVSTYTYDAGGNRTSITYANGVRETYTFDKNNHLLTLQNVASGGSLLSSYTYTYDVAGRQMSKADSYGTTNYAYDEAGRLTKVETPGKTTLYAYDKSGNRLSAVETYTSEQPSGYTDPSNGDKVSYLIKKSEYIYSSANVLQQLVEKMLDGEGQEKLEKTTAYVYDNNGNEVRRQVGYIRSHNRAMKQVTDANPYGDGLTNELYELFEKTTHSYDGFNRLKQAERIQGGTRYSVEYTYDGDGLRTRKESRSSKKDQIEVTNYLYDRQYVILETDGQDQVSVSYVRGINYIARANGSSKTSYFLFNGHGDVVQTVSEHGEIENQYDYDPFGNMLLSVEEEYSVSIRYAGEFYDTEVGLYYLRARYYDPYLGRFISEDTYRGQEDSPLSLNLYTYALNNPITYVDPYGHAAVTLRDLAKATGASLSYNAKTKVTTVTLAPGVTVNFNVSSKSDQKTKGYSVQNGRIVLDNKQYDKLMSQSYTKAKSSITGGKVTVNSKVETAVGSNSKIVAYTKVDRNYDTKVSVVKGRVVKETASVLDTMTQKISGINLTNNKDMVTGKSLAKRTTDLISNIASGSGGAISKPKAAVIGLLLEQSGDRLSEHLKVKYSGSMTGEQIQRTNEGYFGSNLASNDIMNSGKTDKIFEDALKKYYKHVYPESTDQDYEEYKKVLSKSQKNDLESELNAFYSKEVVLYGGYLNQIEVNEKAITAQAILEVATGLAGFGISKGIMKFGSKGAQSVVKGAETVSKIGDDFGKLGKVIENPGLKVDWGQYSKHGLGRMVERNVTTDMVNDWVRNGRVLQQSGGQYLYITKEGAAVVNPNGKLITVMSKYDFDEVMETTVTKLFGK
ncbi:RHS repeat-associated core domain-containing protein [Paenibacillus senegalimassiliensis]|uniref:RHS repeat-associated core domain-containing protein n=1 Tax=Paenibacillus senegalimassiliensis TaxID=1737426 RepID=UPI00073E6F6B|nr:RHS repeat-associated core domain-containing protein [Paenibacillus senegalimassiliensis]